MVRTDKRSISAALVPLPPAVARADFLWPAAKVIAEADGPVKYNDRNDLMAQFERDRRLRDAGYQVIHFTGPELFSAPEIVIARIRQALADKRAW